jgi:signal transduction histidine kinase
MEISPAQPARPGCYRIQALEAQFRESQKLESIGRLAGGVAHDFNNLLTVMLGYSSNLLEHMDRTDPAYGGLIEVRKAAEKGAALTKQLLAFSRRQFLQPELLNLNNLVEEDERMFRRLIGEDIELIVGWIHPWGWCATPATSSGADQPGG